MSVIRERIERARPELIEKFRGFTASLVHESLGRQIANVMDYHIKPVWQGAKTTGSALTVQCFPSDNITVHKALTMAQPGDVMVVGAYGVPGAMWGAQMSFQAKLKGIAGVVIDGSARDVAELRDMAFPCFARYVTPLGSAKSDPGSINISIQCGGVLVQPGDIVVGDDDGVVVVPLGQAERVASRAEERLSREQNARKLYEKGKTSFDLSGFQKIFDDKGIKEE